MPRKARIDAPGALHPIICRGIERRMIFRDDMDRNRFVERRGHVVTETQTPAMGGHCSLTIFIVLNNFPFPKLVQENVPG